MTIVYFVRHGDNDYLKKGRFAGRQKGVSLNLNGHKQAICVANYFQELPIQAIYSSPLERTIQTAEPIAKECGLKVQKRMGLQEIDLGKWEDKKLEPLRNQKVWDTVQYHPSRMRFPAGESFFEAQIRIVQEIDEIVNINVSDAMIVLVTHSDMIKLAIAYYLGLTLDLFQRLVISPASISSLIINESDCRLKFLNYQPFSKFPD